MRTQRNGALLTAWAFLVVTSVVDVWWVRAITACGSLAAAFYAGLATQYLEDHPSSTDTESEDAPA